MKSIYNKSVVDVKVGETILETEIDFMPTSYTHYRFGQQVKEQLPVNIQKIIEDHADLFYVGLHGPDIFFYALPFFRVIEVGSKTHRDSGKEWFTHCGNVLKRDHFDEAELAYMYGFMCHYALDRLCHAYINEVDAEGKVLHMEIEAELDAYYMKKDGLDPYKYQPVHHLHPSWKSADTIQKFFPTLGRLDTYISLRGQVLTCKSLVMPDNWFGGFTRAAFKTILQALSKFSPSIMTYYGLVINRIPNPLCVETNEKLDRLYHECIPQAVQFITDFVDCCNGEKDWSPLFSVNFDGYETADD